MHARKTQQQTLNEQRQNLGAQLPSYHTETSSLNTISIARNNDDALFNAFALALCEWMATKNTILSAKGEELTLKQLGLKHVRQFTNELIQYRFIGFCECFM